MMDIENKYGTLKNQQILLKMVNDLHNFLSINNISYSLMGGSLIGIIREGGFIPWDDDIDIMMDRTNYNKFIQLSHFLVDYKVYRYLWVERIQRSCDINNKLINPLSIPTIDIFIIDNMPNSKFLEKLKSLLIKILQGMMKKKQDYSKFSFFVRASLFFTYILGKLFTDNTKWRLYCKVSQIGNKNTSKYVSCYNDLFENIGLKYTYNLMNDLEIRQFETLNLPITKYYDNYLKAVYGDYHTPPAKSERIPKHII